MEFVPFPKIARFFRQIIVTEKLDGTNAQVCISEDGTIRAGSRNRWITPENDNHGFASWVRDHADDLRTLGPGRHFGEWWGHGINRGYGIPEKRFSLFNVERWAAHGTIRKTYPTDAPRVFRTQDAAPQCCHVVPVLYKGDFDTDEIHDCLTELRLIGSFAAPGFKRPEGVIVFHPRANIGFKATLEDDEPKSIRCNMPPIDSKD